MNKLLRELLEQAAQPGTDDVTWGQLITTLIEYVEQLEQRISQLEQALEPPKREERR